MGRGVVLILDTAATHQHDRRSHRRRRRRRSRHSQTSVQHVVPDVALDVELASAARDVPPQRQAVLPLLGQDRVAEDEVEAAHAARPGARPREAGHDLGHTRGQPQAHVPALHAAGQPLRVVDRLAAHDVAVLVRLLRAAESDAHAAATAAAVAVSVSAAAFEDDLDAQEGWLWPIIVLWWWWLWLLVR